jgi:hypothetical protein
LRYVARQSEATFMESAITDGLPPRRCNCRVFRLETAGRTGAVIEPDINAGMLWHGNKKPMAGTAIGLWI